MENEKKIQQNKDYISIAEFIGYKYFPYSNSMTIQEKDYPGWFDLKGIPDENVGRLFTYKSGRFKCRNTLSLGFRNDFNRLIEAVEFIENLPSQRYGRFIVEIEGPSCTIKGARVSKQGCYYKTYVAKSKKEAVYQAVLLFIKWFNSEEKKKYE